MRKQTKNNTNNNNNKKRCESTEKDTLPLCFHSHGAFLSTNWKKHLVSVKVRHRWQEGLTGNVLSSVSGILKEAVHKHLNYRRPKHHTKLFSPKHRFIWSTIYNCGCSQVVTPCEPFNSLNTCACACTHNTCFIRARMLSKKQQHQRAPVRCLLIFEWRISSWLKLILLHYTQVKNMDLERCIIIFN